MTRRRVALVGAASLALALLYSGAGRAQIKAPGAHPHYTVAVDPHFVVQYADREGSDKLGLGFGARAYIPFVHNGPVPQINNDIGMSFGADMTFFGGDEVCRRRGVTFYASDCSAMNVWLPATGEWNFFLTPIVSVFLDLGLAFQYEKWSFQGLCGSTPCKQSESDFDVEFASWVGARFRIFGDRAGLVVRLGWPYAAAGATILF